MSFSALSIYLTKNRKEFFILITICLLTTFFKLYNLELRLPFGWDQARDASVVWQILVEHKPTLIGPQVVSDNAFFLGPLWYYLLVPFFLISGLDPIGLGWAVTTSAVFTVIVLYLFVRKVAGPIAAIIAATILSTNPDVLAWNPMLVPIFSIGIFYCLLKLIKGNKKYLLPSFLIFGLSLQIHVQMIFFAIPLSLTLIYFLRKHGLPIKESLISLVAFILTFAPLIFFDLRHDLLNLNGIIKIFSGSGSAQTNLSYFDQLSVTFPKTIYSSFFLPNLGISEMIIGPLLIIISVFGLLKLNTPKIFKVLLLTTLLLPVFVFSFYKGRLSEYYFYICLVPLLIGFSNTIQIIYKTNILGRGLIILFLLLVIVLSFKNLISLGHGNGLLYQKQAIEYLVNQKEDSKINLSFDVPYSDDAGMKYLLKFYDLNVSDSPEYHLWTISIPARDAAGLKATFGNIAVIRK